MSKAASAPMQASIAARDLSHVTCWRIKTQAGDISAFTELDDDLLVDLADGDGFVTHAAKTGYSRTNISSTNTLAVDNLDVEGILDPDAFSRQDIIAGVYEGTEVKMFLVNWKDLSEGVIKLRRGTIGNVSMFPGRFEAELRGMLQRYSQEIVGLASTLCRADLGDQPGFSPSIRGCKVQVDPAFWLATTPYTKRIERDAGLGSVVKPTTFTDRFYEATNDGTSGGTEPIWPTVLDDTVVDGGVTWITKQALTIEASVDIATNRGKFSIVYAGDAPDVLLRGGLLFFDTGKNSKLLPLDVKDWDLATRTITLYLPAGFDIVDSTSLLQLEDDSGHLLLENGSGGLLMESGDLVRIRAGCAKDVPACRDAFRNITNARFEPHVPGSKVILRTAAAIFGVK
jgi:uncharacterized phage protein (TIGR02218 family)